MREWTGGRRRRGLRPRRSAATVVVAVTLACGSDTAVTPTQQPARTITGRLVVADDVGPLNRVRITLRSDKAGVQASGLADASGAFEFDANLPSQAGDSLDFTVAVDGDDPPFAPIYKRIAANDPSSYRRPLLIPRRVTIPSGTYAGTIVPVSLEDAFTPICADAASLDKAVRAETPTTTLADAVAGERRRNTRPP